MRDIIRKYSNDLLQGYKNLTPRVQQISVVVSGCLILFFVFVMIASRVRPKAGAASPKKEVASKISLVSGGTSYSREEVWANRMAHKAKTMETTNTAMSKRLELMNKKMDLLQKALTALSAPPKGGTPHYPTKVGAGATFPPQPRGSGKPLSDAKTEVIKAPKTGLALLSNKDSEEAPTPIESVDTWIPSGAHLRGVLTAGVVASTATGASSSPQPVIIRLSENGKAPGGWGLQLKDAHVLAACHGDLASERVYCRLDKISYTEKSGEIVEKPIEGWVVGRDGRYGIRGVVVDRADQQILSSLFAGMISSVSSYMQAQSSKSVFPVSPFGQSEAMSNKDMFKGAGASGAGNAMDRLAKYLIDRAESISPVIVVNSGCSVDISIKSKVDLSNSSRVMREVKPASDSLRTARAHIEAQKRIATLQKESAS